MEIKAVMMAITGCALSFNVMAGTRWMPAVEKCRPWSIIGSLGYTWYSNLYDGGAGTDPSGQASIGDGQTAFGRFAIARDIEAFETWRLGVEIGVQSGNTARLNIPQETLDIIGGLHPQVSIKPMIDILATASWQPEENASIFGIIKPGIAFRRLQIDDRVTFNDLSEVAFEIQAGVGYHINNRASLLLLYQGVLNGGTNYSINTTAATGHISNIPSQNGLMLSLSYSV